MKTSIITALAVLAVQLAVLAASCIVDAGTENYSRSTASSASVTLDVKTRDEYAESSEYTLETRFLTTDVSSAMSLDTSKCGTVILMR